MNHVFMVPNVLLKKTEFFTLGNSLIKNLLGQKNLLLISAALVKKNKNICGSEHRAFKRSKFQN